MNLYEWCVKNEEGKRILNEWTGVSITGEKTDIHKLTVGSRKKMLWRCSKCQNEWYAIIYNRTTLLNNCPACNGKKINQFNSLESWCISNNNEDIVKDFTGICNNEIYKLNEVTFGSRKKLIWRCHKCGYEWCAEIRSRTVLNSGCPACAGQRVTNKNNLEKWCKDNKVIGDVLINEWLGIDSNGVKINMNEVTKGSSKKVNWMCNNGHIWEATIKHRTNGQGCPYCASSRQTSYSEKFIYFALKEIYPDTVSRFLALKNTKFNNGRGIEFDIAIPLKTKEYNAVCIEYSPTKWHKGKEHIDKLKSDICKKYKVKFINIIEDSYNELIHFKNSDTICFKMDYSRNKQDKILQQIVLDILHILGREDKIKYIDFDKVKSESLKYKLNN